jgi:hypothetical protein
VDSTAWIYYCRKVGLYSTFAFTLVSGLHYVFLIGQRIRTHDRGGHPAAPAQ